MGSQWLGRATANIQSSWYSKRKSDGRKSLVELSTKSLTLAKGLKAPEYRRNKRLQEVKQHPYFQPKSIQSTTLSQTLPSSLYHYRITGAPVYLRVRVTQVRVRPRHGFCLWHLSAADKHLLKPGVQWDKRHLQSTPQVLKLPQVR
jgi:hypothetical protein